LLASLVSASSGPWRWSSINTKRPASGWAPLALVTVLGHGGGVWVLLLLLLVRGAAGVLVALVGKIT
jgi:hypothetical protein